MMITWDTRHGKPHIRYLGKYKRWVFVAGTRKDWNDRVQAYVSWLNNKQGLQWVGPR